MKMNLKKVKEVNAMDQFIAVMDLLNALGYETGQLTILDAAQLKYDIIKAIESSEKLEITKSDDGVTVY
jgi:hypothetical protein